MDVGTRCVLAEFAVGPRRKYSKATVPLTVVRALQVCYLVTVTPLLTKLLAKNRVDVVKGFSVGKQAWT